jgi:hypothetical protein
MPVSQLTTVYKMDAEPILPSKMEVLEAMLIGLSLVHAEPILPSKLLMFVHTT